jgi:preprotein translocase subunit SecA
VLDFIGKLFGNKHDRDMKPLWPIVDEVKSEFSKLQSLSNDELRAKTAEFKKRIAEHVASEKEEVAALKAQADKEENMDEKEKIYSQADALEKEIKKKVEDVLKDILPEAFAVIKETARRFKENKELEVTASKFDKDNSVNKKYIQIRGEKAYWQNTWPVRGNDTTWNMVHYDVQLIGGAVLHQKERPSSPPCPFTSTRWPATECMW